VHEVRAGEIVRGHAADMDVVLSHEVWAQEGEYERANAALLNAFARRAMTGYIDELQRFLAERLPHARLLITKSNGGAMNAEEATDSPIHSLLSGPASGVTAASTLGRMVNEPNLLTMDMGGTSTDISIVHQGNGIVSHQGRVGDFPIIMPVVAIESIGAGGGSIAWMDGAVLKVGPRSAGARPGPACYDTGGTQPTLSDAYLLCGYLSETTPLAGEIFLRRDLASAAMRPIAAALHCDVVQAAESCIVVATSNMLARALPFIARIGASPAELTLMIFGGAGAIHGPLLAAEIGIGKVIVPRHSSVFCAFGGLVTDLLYDTVSSTRGERLDAALLRRNFGKMRTEAAAWLRKQAPAISPRYEYLANLRYAGQSFDVPTPIGADMIEDGDLDAIGRAFHAEHLRLFKHAHADRKIDAIGFQLRVRGELPRPGTESTASAPAGGDAAGTPRALYIAGSWHDARCYRQDGLPQGWSAVGPAVIEQTTATTIVPPGFRVTLNELGDLAMERTR
jgi:N-methylhydantoinase A